MAKRRLVIAAAIASAAALLISGCSSSDDASAKRACMILPDSESSARWENGDRPAMDSALTGAGFETDIQNAQGDTAKYATIAEQMLTKGCGVMILVDYQGAGIQVAATAKEAGIPVIAYDRPIEGADYYVSFDNESVGALQGQAILDGLAAAGKDPKTARVIYGQGDPTDGNAKMFYDGALSVLTPAGVKPIFEMAGTWDGAKAGTLFEQALTAVGGKVDAVLDKAGLKVPVSGQDASPAGLQNVLLGKQTTTVWKPYTLIATAASDLAIALLNGETPTADKTLADGTPYIAVTPNSVGQDGVKDVIAAGDAKYDEVCTDAVKAACDEFGVTA
jgi:D-xylose transport system substrate-binding protein